MQKEDKTPILRDDDDDGDAETVITSNNNKSKLGLNYCKQFFGVEFVIFLYTLAFGIYSPAQQNFVYHQICLFRYDDSESICSQIDTEPSLTDLESVVQQDYSVFSTYSNICSSLPSLIVMLIMGSWCDRFSFKIPMILPPLGSAAMGAFFVLYSYFPKMINPTYLGIAQLFSGFSGSYATLLTASAAYISRTTTGRNRTVRLGAIEASLTLGTFVGFLINALLMTNSNPVLAFMIQVALNLYTALFVLVMIPELHDFESVKEKVNNEANGSWFRYIFVPRKEIFGGFVIFFGSVEKYKLIKNYQRAMLAIFAITAASNGNSDIFYEFLVLQPMSITPFDYAIFQAVNSVVGAASLLLFMRLLRHFFKTSDACLVILGEVSTCLALIAIAFGDFYPAYAPWIYSALNIFAFYPYIAIRSGLSKISDESDHGKIFSICGLFENGGSLLMTIAYNNFYAVLVAKTYIPDWFNYIVHGYAFSVAAFSLIPTIFIAIWLGKQGIANWSFHSSIKKHSHA